MPAVEHPEHVVVGHQQQLVALVNGASTPTSRVGVAVRADDRWPATSAYRRRAMASGRSDGNRRSVQFSGLAAVMNSAMEEVWSPSLAGGEGWWFVRLRGRHGSNSRPAYGKAFSARPASRGGSSASRFGGGLGWGKSRPSPSCLPQAGIVDQCFTGAWQPSAPLAFHGPSVPRRVAVTTSMRGTQPGSTSQSLSVFAPASCAATATHAVDHRAPRPKSRSPGSPRRTFTSCGRRR